MTTPHPQHAADTLGDGLGFPGVPEDAPEELDGPPAPRGEALATSSEDNATAGRLAYAVHADSWSPPVATGRRPFSRAWTRRLSLSSRRP